MLAPLFQRLIGRHFEFYVLLARPGLGVRRAAHQSGYGAKRKNRFVLGLAHMAAMHIAPGSCDALASAGVTVIRRAAISSSLVLAALMARYRPKSLTGLPLLSSHPLYRQSN